MHSALKKKKEEEEGNPATCNNVDEDRGHYAE